MGLTEEKNTSGWTPMCGRCDELCTELYLKMCTFQLPYDVNCDFFSTVTLYNRLCMCQRLNTSLRRQYAVDQDAKTSI